MILLFQLTAISCVFSLRTTLTADQFVWIYHGFLFCHYILAFAYLPFAKAKFYPLVIALATTLGLATSLTLAGFPMEVFFMIHWLVGETESRSSSQISQPMRLMYLAAIYGISIWGNFDPMNTSIVIMVLTAAYFFISLWQSSEKFPVQMVMADGSYGLCAMLFLASGFSMQFRDFVFIHVLYYLFYFAAKFQGRRLKLFWAMNAVLTVMFCMLGWGLGGSYSLNTLAFIGGMLHITQTGLLSTHNPKFLKKFTSDLVFRRLSSNQISLK